MEITMPARPMDAGEGRLRMVRRVHHLLVAVDGSERGAHALQHAIGLAREIGDVELHLITVFPEPAIYPSLEVYLTERIGPAAEEFAREVLAPAVEVVMASGVPCTSDFMIGDIARSLARKAEQRGCDGIVMGTRGMSPLANLLMGSVASKLLHLTKLPVTLVH
jgi:nucleotide-binding universal stress UspA family protein